jgi:hypothetical protein
MLSFADVETRKVSIDSNFPHRLGLLPTYKPEFIEARVGSAMVDKSQKIAKELNSVFGPVIEPELTGGGRAEAVQFVLPQVNKTDLQLFAAAQNAYDTQTYEQKLLGHSWLLERGLALCEPSTRIEGMAGGSLSGQGSWIAVPYAAVRGDSSSHATTAAAAA